MVFFDNIKAKLNAFKSHSNHKNTWWLDYHYILWQQEINKLNRVIFSFPPPRLTLSKIKHWVSVPDPRPEMVRNYQRLEIILKIN